MNNPRNKSTYTNANLVLEYVLQCGIDVNVSLWVSLFVGSKNYNCVQFWFHYKDFNLVSSLTKLPLQFKWWIERATHRGPAHWCIVLKYRPAGDLLTRGYEIFVWLICFLERNSCFNDDILWFSLLNHAVATIWDMNSDLKSKWVHLICSTSPWLCNNIASKMIEFVYKENNSKNSL